MSLKRLTQPGTEPVTLAETKLALRIDDSDRDLEINGLIAAARELAEHELGRTLMTSRWQLTLDCFPAEFKLRYAPIQSIVSLAYLDATGAQQTMDAGAYALDSLSEPGWLLPAYGTSWPSALDAANAVTLIYEAGYAAAVDVPAPVRRWIIAKVGEMLAAPLAGSDRPTSANSYIDGLLDPYRIWEV